MQSGLGIENLSWLSILQLQGKASDLGEVYSLGRKYKIIQTSVNETRQQLQLAFDEGTFKLGTNVKHANWTQNSLMQTTLCNTATMGQKNLKHFPTIRPPVLSSHTSCYKKIISVTVLLESRDKGKPQQRKKGRFET